MPHALLMGLSSSHGRPKRSHRRHGRSLLLHAIFARWQLVHAWLIMPSTRRVVSTVASAAVVLTSNGSTLGGSCMLAASRRMQPFVGGKTLTGRATTIWGTLSDLWGQLRQPDCSACAVHGKHAGCSAGAVLGRQASRQASSSACRQAVSPACAVLGRTGCAKATSEATAELQCSTSSIVGSKLAALMPVRYECGKWGRSRRTPSLAGIQRRRPLRSMIQIAKLTYR